MTDNKSPHGAGLGFRRELLPQMSLDDVNAIHQLSHIDFFEVSPENWINSQGMMGGRFESILRAYTERFSFICHGLSLSIGSSKELDITHVNNIKTFMKSHGMNLFTEHLSWCDDDKGHLYDLLPIPCTQEAVFWVADRIKKVQDILGSQIGIENASYYYLPSQSQMSDSEFISAVIKEADCLLHLDVNNIFVNSQNFGFDPHQYLRELPLERTCYLHVAGHYVDDDGLIVDTHGDGVVERVWALLNDAYELIFAKTGKTADKIPTCLERDFNFPKLSELTREVKFIREIQQIHKNNTVTKLA